MIRDALVNVERYAYYKPTSTIVPMGLKVPKLHVCECCSESYRIDLVEIMNNENRPNNEKVPRTVFQTSNRQLIISIHNGLIKVRANDRHSPECQCKLQMFCFNLII